MSPWTPSKLVAIGGGSGAGKTWLARQLQGLLGERIALLSLDDFYRDRSGVPPAEREEIDFDDPGAIDWPYVERVLRGCHSRESMLVPRYDFTTHTRLSELQLWQPAPLVLMEGLWLLLLPTIRNLFDLRIFIDCPEELRLQRRIARDVADRGRSEDSVRRQFCRTVAPMHERYVARQSTWSDLVFGQPVEEATARLLAEHLWSLVSGSQWTAPSRLPASGVLRSPAQFQAALRTQSAAGLGEGTIGV